LNRAPFFRVSDCPTSWIHPNTHGENEKSSIFTLFPSRAPPLLGFSWLPVIWLESKRERARDVGSWWAWCCLRV
jgi:hypothetical protein